MQKSIYKKRLLFVASTLLVFSLVGCSRSSAESDKPGDTAPTSSRATANNSGAMKRKVPPPPSEDR